MVESNASPEAVRLVVWDLDETFWKGTLTEGGIREYVRAHHDMVIELAGRGIMSSICSKNDFDVVMPILDREGIADYFIFPSISWEPKGLRLKQLIEAVQLRPETVLFIDDNPNNLAEAQAIVPGIQVASEQGIPMLLADRRFRGKDDRALSRLKQYKLLEDRKRDKSHATGGNEEFLRSCDIRVMIDHDVEGNIDRAIELINRTNQLNFTKWRLPEDIDAARATLRQQLIDVFGVAGLVRVADKYGDYGFVGFFMRSGLQTIVDGGIVNASLSHFCFSCRTLGMGVEEWVYDLLGRPEIRVVGDVLTDLTVKREIDWIRQVSHIDDETASDEEPIAPKIVMFGGCETNITGTYLQRFSPDVEMRGSYVANGVRVHGHVSAYAADTPTRKPGLFEQECAALGLPIEIELADVFGTAEPGTLFVANFSADVDGTPHMRHIRHGWCFRLTEHSKDRMYPISTEDLDQILDENPRMTVEGRDQMHRLNAHIAENYSWVEDFNDTQREEILHRILRNIPVDSKFVILAPYHTERLRNGELTKAATHIPPYNRLLERVIGDYPYAAVVHVEDAIEHPDEIQLHNHYVRAVYQRLSETIATVARAIPAREKSFVPPPPKTSEQIAAEVKINEARALVIMAYQRLLRREAEQDALDHYTDRLVRGWPAAEFIKGLTNSREFSEKWEPKPASQK